ncbi:MAG: hypothetical protein MUE95_02450 [Cyclobacteriaceae bacterium]|nr:hypothetical protein [Cyclobacteriaceae bacterium]
MKESTYTPVAFVYREIITEMMERGTSGKLFYFNQDGQLDEAVGKIIRLEELPAKGLFVTLDSALQIRIDRIITLYGQPGAAYDEYDAYANACWECKGE